MEVTAAYCLRERLLFLLRFLSHLFTVCFAYGLLLSEPFIRPCPECCAVFCHGQAFVVFGMFVLCMYCLIRVHGFRRKQVMRRTPSFFLSPFAFRRTSSLFFSRFHISPTLFVLIVCFSSPWCLEFIPGTTPTPTHAAHCH